MGEPRSEDHGRELAEYVRDTMNAAMAHADRYGAHSVKISHADAMMAARVAVELLDVICVIEAFKAADRDNA